MTTTRRGRIPKSKAREIKSYPESNLRIDKAMPARDRTIPSIVKLGALLNDIMLEEANNYGAKWLLSVRTRGA